MVKIISKIWTAKRTEQFNSIQVFHLSTCILITAVRIDRVLGLFHTATDWKIYYYFNGRNTEIHIQFDSSRFQLLFPTQPIPITDTEYRVTNKKYCTSQALVTIEMIFLKNRTVFNQNESIHNPNGLNHGEAQLVLQNKIKEVAR